MTFETDGIVDMHVHVVGNGSSGSGCWLNVTGFHRPLASLMLRHIGLPASALSGDLDQLYLARLLETVRASSIKRAIILAQDMVHDDSGRVRPDLGSFYVPNSYVLELASKHSEFLPAVSIHPARADAMEELDRCISAGAVMMKCLPNCQNIDCSNPNYTRFWKRMAEAGIPLLAHTGGEHTVPVVRADYADPRRLVLPLECGVTVIAAHSGTKSGLFDPDYFGTFVEMTGKYQNFYGDISAFSIPIRGRRIRECLKDPLVSRLVHGSDFPVPVYGHWLWLRRLVGWSTFRTWQKSWNVMERDYQLKRAMGFPEEVFTRVSGLLPRHNRAVTV
ncbi:MAG: amidohydrolase family protein [Verrucomicrobiota bacterium]|jgi:hypothetical protein